MPQSITHKDSLENMDIVASPIHPKPDTLVPPATNTRPSDNSDFYEVEPTAIASIMTGDLVCSDNTCFAFLHHIYYNTTLLPWLMVLPTSCPTTKFTVNDITISICSGSKTPISQPQLYLASKFQCHLYDILLRPFKHHWKLCSGDKFFLLLPAVFGEFGKVNWLLIEDVCREVVENNSISVPTPQNLLTNDRVIYTICDPVQLYIAHSFSELTPLSQLPGSTKYKNFVSFFQEHWNLSVPEDQKLLCCSRLPTARSLEMVELSSKTTCGSRGIYLVPSLCKFHPLSLSLLQDALALPSIMQHFEVIMCVNPFLLCREFLLPMI